jgi:hypothetical protein
MNKHEKESNKNLANNEKNDNDISKKKVIDNTLLLNMYKDSKAFIYLR